MVFLFCMVCFVRIALPVLGSSQFGMLGLSCPLQSIFNGLFRSYLDKRLSTNTLYIIIAGISGVAMLLLVVVGTLLCRSRSNGGYANGMKHKGYTAAATSPGKGAKNKNRAVKPPDLWIHLDQIELKGHANSNEAAQRRNSQEFNDDFTNNPYHPVRNGVVRENRKLKSFLTFA